MTLGERIREVRTRVKPKLSQEAFAQSIGKTRPAVAAYELDKVIPDNSVLIAISNIYNVSYAWLKTGEGEMEPVPVEDDTPGRLTARYRKGGASTKVLLRALAELDDDWYEKLMDAIRRCEAEYSAGNKDGESE